MTKYTRNSIAHFVNLSRLLLSLGLLLGVIACSPADYPTAESNRSKTPAIHGIRVQSRSIQSREAADETLARIEAGNFNAIFLNVWSYGHAFYYSDLLEKHPNLEPDYDALAYVVEWANERDIDVHAWLVAGPVAYKGHSPILSRHPHWAMTGPDGRLSEWLNYNRPDVRQFIGDVALEIVTNYDVAGIHFDYTRYPGPEWGYDGYTEKVLKQEYELDLATLRYAELPAYATFRGSPLDHPQTAQVLARFDKGPPAIFINRFGKGQVLVFNWEAQERQIAASSEILRRSLDAMLANQGDLYILRSETNIKQRGPEGFEQGLAWLEDMGQKPVVITEQELLSLDVNAVLVMPNLYFIKAQIASELANFVYTGGDIIFIDGPAKSITDKNIQAITGMAGRARFLSRGTRLLTPTTEHPLIPTTDRTLAPKDYPVLDARWKQFRAGGVSKVLQEVYHRIKQKAPKVQVTITVAANQDTLANRHFLDWQAWLDGGYVDLVNPRAYVDEEPLAPVIADWQPALKDSDRLILSLKVFSRQNGQAIPKTPDRMLSEIELALASGSKGVILFNVHYISDEILDMLATGPFSPATVSSD